MKKDTDLEVTVDDIFDSELSTADYGFIMNGAGELKAVFMPRDGGFDVPEVIQKVFNLFGIKDPEGVQVHTVH
jgi:hypothetical protein